MRLYQQSYDVQMKRLGSAKMWDAIEQYSSYLASSNVLSESDLREVRRKRFLQHFQLADYQKAIQCDVSIQFVMLLFAELLPKKATNQLIENLETQKNIDDYLQQELPSPLFVLDSH
jgi:hypothetical protein